MTPDNNQQPNYMALDVGSARVGVALANSIARLPRPHTTLSNDENLWETLREICRQEAVGTVIVGLPRGLEGQDTAQTAYCRAFAADVAAQLGIHTVLQDEALTSQKAELELAAAKRPGNHGDVDSLAATYILEDYLKDI